MRYRIMASVVASVAAAALFGCAAPAGRESFDRGTGLAKQQRYEDAITMYEEALAKEPENPEYSAAYSSAKRAVAAKAVESAKSMVGTGEANFDTLGDALKELEKALLLEPGNGAAKQMSVLLKGRMEGLVKKADELYTSALKAVEAKSWLAAADRLSEIATFYPNYLDLPIRLQQVKEEGANYYRKEAERLKGADDLSGALKSLSSAQKLQPENLALTAALTELRKLNTPEHFLAKAQAQLKKGEYDAALDAMQKARELSAGADTLAQLQKLSKEASTALLEKSREALSAKNLFGAYYDYLSVLKFDKDAPKEPATAELRDRIAAAALERAENYESVSRFGNALNWQEKAMKISSQPENVQKIQALKEKLRQRVVKKIALMDFTSPSTNPDAGRIVTDNLLSYLTRNSSGDMKILARDVLGTLLKEIELGQAGLYDIESAKKGGKLKGTDVFIFGSVLNYNVEKNVDEGLKMVNAVVGSKTIPNPAYQEWLNNQKNLSERELLNPPPKTVKEEIREIVKYKVATHKKTATVSVSFRVIDVEEGEVIITKTLKKKMEATDTYSEGVEFANIPFKELKLPSDSELLEQVVDSIIAELGYAVLSRFQNLQVLYSNSAETLKTKGDPELVIERYTDAIIAEEIKNSPTQISEKAKNEIEAQLKLISTTKVPNELSQAERASLEKAPQMRIPLAVKLPPDQLLSVTPEGNQASPLALPMATAKPAHPLSQTATLPPQQLNPSAPAPAAVTQGSASHVPTQGRPPAADGK